MEATTQEMAITDMSATSMIGRPQDRKIGQSRMPNRTIQFLQRQQWLLVAVMSEKHRRMDPLLINPGAVRGGQG
jgi:hypothetical protein